MQAQEQAKFEGWAIVDVLGHQRYAGYVTTEAYGQAVLFRVEVPALEARERVTQRDGWLDSANRYVPSGTTVHEGPVQGYTKLIGSGSIYAITPCTKEAVLAAVERLQARPFVRADIPPDRALPEAGAVDDDGLDDDDAKCEGCGKPAEGDDVDGVPLCRECAAAAPVVQADTEAPF